MLRRALYELLCKSAAVNPKPATATAPVTNPVPTTADTGQQARPLKAYAPESATLNALTRESGRKWADTSFKPVSLSNKAE
jgi:hypothetical protein